MKKPRQTAMGGAKQWRGRVSSGLPAVGGNVSTPELLELGEGTIEGGDELFVIRPGDDGTRPATGVTDERIGAGPALDDGDVVAASALGALESHGILLENLVMEDARFSGSRARLAVRAEVGLNLERG
jgi:hypothetical protein